MRKIDVEDSQPLFGSPYPGSRHRGSWIGVTPLYFSLVGPTSTPRFPPTKVAQRSVCQWRRRREYVCARSERLTSVAAVPWSVAITQTRVAVGTRMISASSLRLGCRLVSFYRLFELFVPDRATSCVSALALADTLPTHPRERHAFAFRPILSYF